ncbi:MAG: hypothetical protein AB3X36_00325, partial [Leptothrix ochracea]|uniref:hypothetical protein n=1 Tax=Leptothrix ochracea TaxID=735331 RepID=UPI0034E2E1C3
AETAVRVRFVINLSGELVSWDSASVSWAFDPEYVVYHDFFIGTLSLGRRQCIENVSKSFTLGALLIRNQGFWRAKALCFGNKMGFIRSTRWSFATFYEIDGLKTRLGWSRV